ncbi:nuclear transport factor 2 family protein [Croceitalea rosinachiae]|uniref:Nuclear transport factor 2 family protein n=1 Tax=Croceitalea rosinachiae TaxID=3075596 RepID=A0ABU3AA64_9FLAO|nr:nuclear transport factor 2 family protein [Croceitalea sp. F388]MDT0606854.1 nuclear transport factor 2 family protein [Croceitalea sp. F388]
MRKLIPLMLFAVLLTAFNRSQKTTAYSDKTNMNSKISTMDKKETALAFVQAVTSQDADKVRALANEDYIQHNPFLPTGLEPFIGLFPVLKENGTQAQAARILEDGDFVVLHQLWTGAKPFGAEKMVSFDVLRFDKNGKIAEHWDALQPVVTETASGRSQTDGASSITDLDKTDENKVLAKAMVEDILMGKNPNKITDYISAEQYDQHNPGIKDGLSGIIEAVEYLTAQNNMFKYSKIHKVLGEGDFVLTISEGEWSGKQQVFYDLLRFENGKAVEHWDVIQEIPTEGLANNNGMFGF